MPRTLGTGEIDRELDVELLKTSVKTAQMIGGTPMLMKILKRRANKLLRECPDVPDWVEAMAKGDADQPTALLEIVLDDMKVLPGEEGGNGSV